MIFIKKVNKTSEVRFGFIHLEPTSSLNTLILSIVTPNEHKRSSLGAPKELQKHSQTPKALLSDSQETSKELTTHS